MNPVNIDEIVFQKRFSICTIVTNWDEYLGMVESFRQAGFGSETQFIYIDNTKGNKYDGFDGINLFLAKASGEYVVVCHQDVLAIDTRAHLELIIRNVETKDCNWGILGNAGGNQIKQYAKYFVNGHNHKEITGVYPARVKSLDENFLIINHKANIAPSMDMGGFHLYGTDLCLLADIRGYCCYVIDYMVQHKSFGTVDHFFHSKKAQLINSYQKKLRGRLIQTVCVRFYISSSMVMKRIVNTRLVMFFIKEYFKLRRKF